MAYSVDPKVITKKLYAALKLLEADTTTRDKFDCAKTLIAGLNPRIDSLLSTLSAQLSQIEKLQKGEVIELTAEHLPETTAEEKKRKRLILLFIKTWKDLKGEVARVQKELNAKQGGETRQSSVDRFVKIASTAKGPFGIITIAAVIFIGATLLIGGQYNSKNTTTNESTTAPITPTNTAQKIQAIKVGEKTVILTKLISGQGQECLTGNKEAVHYHAKDHTSARATDGSMINDPGGCGFGKVDDVEIILVSN